MRMLLIAAIAGLCGLSIGCTVFEEASSSVKQTAKLFRPRTRDYSDDNVEGYVDPWAEVGAIGRADQPVEKESDPLTPALSSPKARAINRSLGFE